MESKEIEISKPVTIDGITLIPVTKLSLNCQPIGDSISCFGVKQLVSVVVISPSTRKAFKATGEEIPLDQLLQEVPNMREVLERD